MKHAFSILSLAAILLSACSDSDEPLADAPSAAPAPPVAPSNTAPNKNRIFVSNYPLAYFTGRLGGASVRMVLPNFQGDLAYWKPKASDLPVLQESRLILFNGAGYEQWARTLSLPSARIVNTSEAFSADYIDVDNTVSHTHGPAGDHSHEGTAFTTWLDFNQAALQAKAVRDSLVNSGLLDAKIADDNFAGLQSDLITLDEAMLSLTAGKESFLFLASHPVYDYLARRYNLNIESVVWEPNVAPSEEQWSTLETLLKTHPAKWMIWEGMPLRETANRLASLGVRSVVVDPCGNPPSQGDFISVMLQNIDALNTVFASE